MRVAVNADSVDAYSGPFQVTAQCEISPDAAPAVASIWMPWTTEASSTAEAPSNYVELPNPRSARWKLGFLQAQIMEVAWAYYRGPNADDGCVLLDLTSRRTSKICRDYNPDTNDLV
jgi:hypothetical protein